MYLDRVFSAVNEYDATLKAAKELWDNTKKKLVCDYGNVGRLYEEKYAEGKLLYDSTVGKAKQKGLEVVKDEFSKLNKIVVDFITTPVPSDFIPTLEAVKATGEEITETEADVYLEKYKNNYTAYRSIAKCIQAQTGRIYSVVAYDAIKKEMDELSDLTVKIFENSIDELTKALFLSDQHSPLLKLDAMVQDFITKDVGSYKSAEVM